MAQPTDVHDSRVMRTRSQLKSALLSLLTEQPFSQIKTKQITEKANMNRVTFYDHYATKEELLFELIDDVLGEYAAILKSLPDPKATQPSDIYRTIQHSIRHIKMYSEFYKVMLLTNGVPELSNRLHALMSDSFHAALLQLNKTRSEIDYDLYISWVIGGAIGVFKYWLQNGMRQSEEEVSKQLLKITVAAGHVVNPRILV
ncbi:MAG: hypothetical protein K0Q59_673 [Paenibacillus sp.]|jgi:AcrR family transcriptional regulator|nr:hypothetical protein [Paenibacillus sp.]